MKFQTNNSRNKSASYFHTTTQNYNCAQSILKGFQKEFEITDTEIEEFRAWGGGRAKDGICGAIFAANYLISKTNKPTLTDKFQFIAGGIKCTDIKEKKFSCAEYVRIADELLEKYR